MDMTPPITVTLTIDAGVAVIRFDRPDAHNALTLAAMAGFAQHVADIRARPDIRAVVLAGAGDAAFCSGADIHEMHATLTDETAARAMIDRMGDALIALERLPVPVIAGINGYALGGGAEIALACDLRLVDEAARLGFVHIRRGLIPGWGGGQRLVRVVGHARAIDILLHGHTLRADELLAHGIAQRVVARGTAVEHALTMAQTIARLPAEVVAAIKASARASIDFTYDDALLRERALFPPLWMGEARVRSMESFIQRNDKG